MRSIVFTAVPDGASIFRMWCSSITSAVSNQGAAISAKRIISTAEIAKFGAIRQFGPLGSAEGRFEQRQVVHR